jgi:ankyrin repeat protein
VGCSNGSKSAISLLLSIGNADVNAENASGRTALSWAAQNGNEAAVKLLLDTHDIKADKGDINGRTPLLWATERGHFVAVKMLFGRGDVNIAVEDACGLTAMQLAALNYHEEVEALLLASHAPTVEDFYGFQALFMEAMAFPGPS